MLEPIQPRLYSIASSPAPGRVALTIDVVRYTLGERERHGIASTFLGDRHVENGDIKVYVQKAHNFALPADPATPIVMVGPGTGVAPFRAFLEERKAVGAPGKAWLFYARQREATDFFYADDFDALQSYGALSRLSVAWSRDGAEKVYVQHRVREAATELYAWLEAGAHFYVCGDAKRMAKDVETALIELVAVQAGKSLAEARTFIDGLK